MYMMLSCPQHIDINYSYSMLVKGRSRYGTTQTLKEYSVFSIRIKIPKCCRSNSIWLSLTVVFKSSIGNSDYRVNDDRILVETIMSRSTGVYTLLKAPKATNDLTDSCTHTSSAATLYFLKVLYFIWAILHLYTLFILFWRKGSEILVLFFIEGFQ